MTDDKMLGVLQCYRCGHQIDEGDLYWDLAITKSQCPSHEDYLEWDPVWEEYLCGLCTVELNWFLSTKPILRTATGP